jgi:hypothetical protein
MRSEVSNGSPFWQHELDALVERYVVWREESRTVRLAYERWCGAERPTRSLAYAAYRAALEREERAAWDYAAHIDLVKRHCT